MPMTSDFQKIKKKQKLNITEIKTNWIHFNVQGLYYKDNGGRTLFIAMACSVCCFLDYLSKSPVFFCWKLHYPIQSFQNLRHQLSHSMTIFYLQCHCKCCKFSKLKTRNGCLWLLLPKSKLLSLAKTLLLDDTNNFCLKK